ncbi:MAG TPA: ABC transporter permease [Gammaproteobacteria bacterium]
MRRAIAVVCRKEVLETVRDRRTVFSLLLGPLLGPMLFAVLMSLAVSQTVSSVEEPLDVPMLGIEQAPNLEAFLAARGIRPLAGHGLHGRDDAAAAVARGEHDVVLALDERFAKDFGTATAARLTLIYDRSKSRAASRVERVRGAINAYASQIGTLRLVALGVDPALLRPISIDERDVSTPAGRAALMLGMLTYFLLFAMLTGGLHLAIDSTAGERERRSLEPLLGLPVPRTHLLLGKMAATVVYMLLALGLTLVAFPVALHYLPLERIGMSAGFGAGTALAVFGVLAPFAPLGAAVMMLVASFTKTYREAQTYLTFVLLVPTIPLVFAMILNVEPRAALMWIPSLSQHLQIMALLKQEPLPLSLAALSAGTTLAFGAAVTALAARLYRRESLLG